MKNWVKVIVWIFKENSAFARSGPNGAYFDPGMQKSKISQNPFISKCYVMIGIEKKVKAIYFLFDLMVLVLEPGVHYFVLFPLCF